MKNKAKSHASTSNICCISLFSDVITIEKTNEHFRLIYDVKGRFTVHRISVEEAKVSSQLSSFSGHSKLITVKIYTR